MWALLCQFLRLCLAKYRVFLSKDRDCSLQFCFHSDAAFPFLSACFWEKQLDYKYLAAVKIIKDGDDFFFFLWEHSANTGKRSIVLTSCRSTSLFLCFILLVGRSLMCSGTSALTSLLTVTQFLLHAKQSRGSSGVSECILTKYKLYANKGRSNFFQLLSSLYIWQRFIHITFTWVVHCAVWNIDPFPQSGSSGGWKLPSTSFLL